MALINVEEALAKALRALSKLAAPGGVEILTYKRNRGVVARKLESGSYEVRERGYLEQTLVVEQADLAKTLRSILKRECPRSRKVRVYVLKSPEQMGRPLKKL